MLRNVVNHGRGCLSNIMTAIFLNPFQFHTTAAYIPFEGIPGYRIHYHSAYCNQLLNETFYCRATALNTYDPLSFVCKVEMADAYCKYHWISILMYVHLDTCVCVCLYVCLFVCLLLYSSQWFWNWFVADCIYAFKCPACTSVIQ